MDTGPKKIILADYLRKTPLPGDTDWAEYSRVLELDECVVDEEAR